eukprot:7095323-Pyramimonas_sp.AAC.1
MDGLNDTQMIFWFNPSVSPRFPQKGRSSVHTKISSSARISGTGAGGHPGRASGAASGVPRAPGMG